MKKENYKQLMETTNYEDFVRCFDEGCTRCTLSAHDNHPVLYRGNIKAPIVIVGEAPGEKENQNGEAFTGPAGQLLDKILYAVGIDTNQSTLLTNVVYCRPVAPKLSGKQNYTPKKEQTVRCWPFTRKAIKILKPRIVIACGRTAMHNLMGNNTDPISMWEGKWTYYTQLGDTNQRIPMFIMTHPAAILHQAHDPDKQKETKLKVWKYMQYFRDTYVEKL